MLTDLTRLLLFVIVLARVPSGKSGEICRGGKGGESGKGSKGGERGKGGKGGKGGKVR